MRRIKAVLIFVLLCSPAFAAFNATMQFDVRTTGATTNSGGYDPGVASPGTNEAMQDAGTAMTIVSAGTTGTCSPSCTSTTHGPGNTFIIASGAGCSTGVYEILSQAAGTVTFDRTTGAGTCIGVMGGGLTTIAAANALAINSNTINIKTGTYTITSSIAVGQNTITWTGYGTTWADGGTPYTLTTATNSVTLVNTGSSNGGTQTFNNFIWSSTAATRGSGIWQLSAHGTTQTWIFNGPCTFDGFQYAVDDSNGTPDDVAFAIINGCEIKNSTTNEAVSTVSSSIGYIRANNVNFHDNRVDIDIGFLSKGGSIVRSTFCKTNTAAIFMSGGAGPPVEIDSNSLFGASLGGAGITTSTNGLIFPTNNIIYGFTTGVLGAGNLQSNQSSASARNNAYGGNIANFNGFTANSSDITLSADPFTSSSTCDLTLNNTAGGGAAVRGAGYGGSNLDVGASQHAAGAAVGTGSYAN